MSNGTSKEARLYPVYRESDIPWMGAIPEHWGLRRLKAVAKIRTGGRDTIHKKEDGKYPFFIRSQTAERIDTWSYDGEGVLTAGDGAVGEIFHYVKGKFDFHQRVYLFSDFFDVLGKFFFHYLKATLRHETSQGTAKSTVESLRLPMLQNFPVPLPPPEEQAAIVRYLNDVDQRIRAYVSAKERLIALLEEERQAVIHQAVTRGLDPNVKLKPSGVEWLGDVPEHWDVRRLKFSYSETDERSTTGSEELMSVSHKTGVTPRKKNVTMFLAQSNEGYKVCRTGDIVVNTMWAYMAALGISRQTGLVSPSYGVYRPIRQDNLNHEYIDVLLRTETYRTAYVMLSTGITDSRLRLYADSFLGIYLLHPPVSEQAAIVRFIDKATADIDAAIDLARGQIELMEEYRTRLIADVVTGKIDVRT